MRIVISDFHIVELRHRMANIILMLCFIFQEENYGLIENYADD